MSARILVVTADLFVWAKVRAAAEARGNVAIRASDDASLEAAIAEGGVRRVLVDLTTPGLDHLAWARRWKSVAHPPEIVAHGPHVDDAGLARAVEAGFDQVMPNSRFHRLLDHLTG